MKIDKKKKCVEEDCNRRDSREIKRITWIGLAFNTLLAALKFIVGSIGSSQAVIADAVHSLSDCATDFAVIFGVKFWTAPPDENHPYGHRRIESLVTVAIGMALAFVAFGIVFKALTSLRDTHVIQSGWIAVTGLCFLLFSKRLYTGGLSTLVGRLNLQLLLPMHGTIALMPLVQFPRSLRSVLQL